MTNIKKVNYYYYYWCELYHIITIVIIDFNYIIWLLLLFFFIFIDIMGPRREAHARDDVCTQYVRICMCVYRGRERER